MRKNICPDWKPSLRERVVKKYFRASGRIYDTDGCSGSLYGTSVSVVIQLRW